MKSGDHEGLGQFLRARRAVMPARGDRRRVPGWRREEVAITAGVSADYLIRLEQGRATRPSPEVLDALATALQLDEHERAYLRRLAGSDVVAEPRLADDSLPPELLDLIEVISTPAFIMDENLDIIAGNDLAAFFFDGTDDADPSSRTNLALLTFGSATFKALYDDWPAKAQTVTAMLRYRLPSRPGLQRIVDQLRARHPEFASMWDEWRVAEKQRGRAHLRHAGYGVLQTSFQLMPFSGTRFELAVYTTPSGSESRRIIDATASEVSARGALAGRRVENQ